MMYPGYDNTEELLKSYRQANAYLHREIYELREQIKRERAVFGGMIVVLFVGMVLAGLVR